MSASGVAAILNPNGPEGQKIHLFYNTNTKNLGFQFFDEAKHTDETEAFAAGVDGYTGFVVNPGQVAGTTVTGVELVVGFTNKPSPPASEGCKCDSPTQNDISLISPVYKPLAATELTNLTIAATSSDTTAYIYYLTGTDSPKLNELTVGDDSPGVLSGSLAIVPNSSLAAFYIPADDRRFIIFQGSDDLLLHSYCPVRGPGAGNNPIDDTGNARDNTPLGAVYVKETNKAHLYYVDRTNTLRAIDWDGAENMWGSSRHISHAPTTVDKASQITVVPSDAGNHIFYIGAGQGKKFQFAHGMDVI